MFTLQSLKSNALAEDAITEPGGCSSVSHNTSYILPVEAKRCFSTDNALLILMPVTLCTVFTEIAFHVGENIKLRAGKLGIFARLNILDDNAKEYNAVDDQLFRKFDNSKADNILEPDILEPDINGKIILYSNYEECEENVFDGKSVFNMLDNSAVQIPTHVTPLYLGYTSISTASVKGDIRFSASFTEKEGYYI